MATGRDHLAGNAQVPVGWSKVEMAASLDLVGHISSVPQNSHCLMESAVTQEGLKWGPQNVGPRAGTQLPEPKLGPEYVKLKLFKTG